jgi:hypothetical protein
MSKYSDVSSLLFIIEILCAGIGISELGAFYLLRKLLELNLDFDEEDDSFIKLS